MRREIILTTGIIIVLFSALFLSPSAFAMDTRGVSENTVNIGVICDQTGPASSYGIAYIAAIRTYFKYVNDQGGIHGRKIKLFLEDDRYNIPLSMAAFKKLVYKDKVLAIFGPSGTGMTTANISIIERQKVPTISFSSSDIIFKPVKKHLFSIACSYEDLIAIAMDYITEDLKAEKPKIAFVYPDNEYGKDGLNGAIRQAGFHNVELYKEVLNFGAVDATTQILHIKRARVKFVLIHQTIGSTVALLKAARRFGYKPGFWGLGHAAHHADTVKIAKGAAEGFMGVGGFCFWYEDNPGMKNLREITLKYQPGIVKKIETNDFYPRAWVQSIVYAEAMKRAGKQLTIKGFRDAIESLKDFRTGNIGGPITYSPTNHKATNYGKVYKADVQKGLMLPITDWRKPIH